MTDRGWNRSQNRGSWRGFGRDRGSFHSANGFSWRGRRGNFRDQPYGGNRGGKFHDNSYGGRNPNQQRYNRIKRDTPGKRLTEEEIGVTEYISDHKGFNGIIKSRYSDFQVSEINIKGKIAKLTDMNPPEPPAEDVVEDEDLLLSKYNVELLPMETWDRINKLAVCSEPTTERVEVDVTGMSKEQRTKIHDALKKAFGDAIVSSTVTVEDKKYVRLEKYRKGVRFDNRVKWVWPGEFVHFVLYKENCDTMEAAAKVAERLRHSNVRIHLMLGYAGTKDRRAKTSQWMSVRRVEPAKIAASCRDMRELKVGNYTFSDMHLKLGMLAGNRFRIALRNVTGTDEEVNRACKNFKESGFINFYGLQRFGTRVDTPTYEIGKKMLQGNFKEAIDCVLSPREGPLWPALSAYRTHGPAAAGRLVPRHDASSEGRLLLALAKEPNDLLGALSKLARNTRLLYIHSYQSLVWNRCVSERVRRLGLGPAVGDLVLQGGSGDEVIQDDDVSDSEETENGGEDVDGKNDDDLETPKDNVEVVNKNKNQDPKPKIPVKVLSEEDVDSGRYTLMDVVMPLPGYNIDYPPNMKDYYEELLTKDNLTLEMKHKYKSYSMSGAYRRIVVKASEMDWKLVRYSDPTADLILSDYDELTGQTSTGIVEDGKYKALLLSFNLPASCYATMALRELLKVDTSSDNQAAQNDYHKKDDKQKEEQDKEVGKNEKDEIVEKIEDGVEKRKLVSGDEEVEAKKVKQDSESTQ